MTRRGTYVKFPPVNAAMAKARASRWAKPEDRFRERVQQGERDACWPWTGTRTDLGYGRMSIDGKFIFAHRAAWLFAHGERAPAEFDVLHSCDNRLCCNPAHLRLGTHQDNMRDRKERGRTYRVVGEACPFSKLTEAQVREIRARLATGELATPIARDFRISITNVCDIKTRRIWKHI